MILDDVLLGVVSFFAPIILILDEEGTKIGCKSETTYQLWGENEKDKRDIQQNKISN
jgi:hypothetical protein